MSDYWQYSRSAYYSLIAAIPLLIGYEILVTISQTPYWGVRNAADVWIRTFMMAFDLKPQHLTFVMIAILFGLIPFAKMKSQGIQLKTSYFAIILGEAFIYSLLLGIILRIILGIGGLSAGGLGTSPLQNLALSLGAGLFEEVFFRVFLLNLLFFLFKPVFRDTVVTAVIAILTASFLFSLSHYIGNMADTWQLYSFMFRWIAGVLFTALYFVRGFAVTAYTHAFYDIWVLT